MRSASIASTTAASVTGETSTVFPQDAPPLASGRGGWPGRWDRLTSIMAARDSGVSRAVAGAQRRLVRGWGRTAALVLLGAAVVAQAAATVGDWSGYVPRYDPAVWGQDFAAYRDAAARWLAGGPFYDPAAIAGPWQFRTFHEVVYPPTSLALLAPFTVLPAALWWAVPALALAWCLRACRPSPIAWALIAVALLSRTSVYAWAVGNPVIWEAGALAVAVRRPWGWALAVVKPSWAPLALLGAHDHRWWAVAALWGAAALLTLPLWPEWVAVMRNAPGFGYSLVSDLPVVAVPLLARLGARPTPPS